MDLISKWILVTSINEKEILFSIEMVIKTFARSTKNI